MAHALNLLKIAHAFDPKGYRHSEILIPRLPRVSLYYESGIDYFRLALTYQYNIVKMAHAFNLVKIAHAFDLSIQSRQYCTHLRSGQYGMIWHTSPVWPIWHKPACISNLVNMA
jgi:hypothetical protein